MVEEEWGKGILENNPIKRYMSGLFLNFIEYELSKDTFSVFALPYKNYPTKDKYLELKNSNPDWAFYRQGETIFYWQKNPNTQNDLGGNPALISTADDPKVVSKIVETGIIEFLFSLDNYKIKKNRHSHTWQLVSRKDALGGKINGLEVSRRMSMSPLFICPGDSLRYGLTFSNNLKYRFTWTLEDFKNKGIEVSNLRLADDNSTVIPDYPTLYHFLAATGQQTYFEQEIEALESTAQTFQIISRTVAWLEKNKHKIFLPDHVEVSRFHFRYLPVHGIRAEKFYSPKRYFYGGTTNTKKLRFYNEMVKQYKPASFGQFDERDTHIAVVFPAEYEGVTEVFLKTLERSLKDELHLKRLSFDLIKIKNTSLEDYEAGIYRDNEIVKRSDLFIIIVNQEHEKLPPGKSPYYYCKAKLLGDGIPTQDIQIETIKQRIHPLTLSNICLNIYAKLGGTAWTIEKEEKKKDELVVGIGSTVSSNGKSIMGIAQVFHSDGRYIVGDCAPLSTYDNYSSVLEEYLYQTLSKVIENYIDTGERFRLIFHLFKSAGKDNEVKAVENVTKRLSNFQFDFALVHLGYGHNYRLYNNDGKNVIDRGTFVKVDPRVALVQFVPKSCLPLKVELDRRSVGFTDLFYIAKQVYWFASLSHRSYNPSKRTVTIMYPTLMAGLIEKLSEVPNWNTDRIKFVSDKLWFI